MNSIKESEIRLSAQRALWGSVPTSLRSFSCEINGTVIKVQAIFDDTVTNEHKDLLTTAATEIIADYDENFILEEEYLVMPVNQEMEFLRFLIYLRHEPTNAI